MRELFTVAPPGEESCQKISPNVARNGVTYYGAMNKAKLKRSYTLISELLEAKEVTKGIKQFEKIWEDGDDDKAVMAKFRAFRAEQLARFRYQLVVLEAATHQRLNPEE